MLVKRNPDARLSQIAAAIGEPARACILLSLMDGHARSSTELAVVAGVSPSTTSVHLSRLKTEGPITARIQGKHHFYSLAGQEVACALEGLSVLAGGIREQRASTTPTYLRAARTCYDHMAAFLLLLGGLVAAQRGTAPNNCYPDAYNGSIFTGREGGRPMTPPH